jgi:hypothetical protein
MINLNRPTEDDAAALRQSRIVAFDAIARRAPREPAPTPYEVAVYAFECEDHSIQQPAKLSNAAIAKLAYDVLADNLNATSGAALVGTKPQPDADGWIPFVCTATSVCPVPPDVDFEIRTRGNVEVYDRRDAIIWRIASTGEPWDCDVVAYRILPAKPAAIPGWRRGPDVPESERKGGLWFARAAGGWYSHACAPENWKPSYEYRPAPPGVKDGDPYSPALYGEEA